MSRYAREFDGIPAGYGEPRGADPNFEDGYRGMRMRGGGGRAAYGSHRLQHRYDLHDFGGFGGMHSHGPPPSRDYDWPYRGPSGVRPPRDPRLIREFNANSPVLERYGSDYGRNPRRDGRRSGRHDERYEPGYSNRGLGQGGYSEAWSFRPFNRGR